MPTVEPSPAPGSPVDLRESLRRAIADGEYPPGAKLIERELTQKYGVGRTGVRDALRHLAAEHILELTANRGARVRQIDYAEALDIYQIRGVLEGLAAELFTLRGTAEEKLRFAESLLPVRAAMGKSDIAETLAASDVYYAHMLNGARNAELREAVERLHVRVNQIRRVSVSMEERVEPTLQALQRIADAVLAGDPAEARLACTEHIKASAAATLPILAARGLKQASTAEPDGARPHSP